MDMFSSLLSKKNINSYLPWFEKENRFSIHFSEECLFSVSY